MKNMLIATTLAAVVLGLSLTAAAQTDKPAAKPAAAEAAKPAAVPAPAAKPAAGGAWIDAAELTLAGGSSNRLREVLWLGTSGVALAAYPASGGGAFRFALYLEHGWRVQPSVSLPGVGRAAALELLTNPDGSATGVLLDIDGALHALRHEDGQFRRLGDEAPLATGLDPSARVFALAPGR